MDYNGNINAFGNISVLGKYLNLKPEVLQADPIDLTEPRLWIVGDALRFFTGASTITLDDSGLTETEVDAKLQEYFKTADLAPALVPYAQKTEVTSEIGTAVQNLVSETELQNALENALTGLDYQKDVVAFSTQFNGIEGRYIYDGAGETADDGDTVAANDIVYIDASNSILRVEYAVSAAGEGALVWNRNGESGDLSGHWLRWDGVTWERFGGLTEIQINNSLQKDANVLGLKVDGDSLVVTANGVKVGDLSSVYVTPAALSTAIANFVTAAQVGTQISTALEDYSTTTEVQSAIDASLVPYAKTADVATTVETALVPYAKTADVNTAISTATADLVSETDLTSALVPYAQKTEVTSEISTAVQNLVSETDLQNAVENAVAGLDYQEDVLGFDTDFTVAGRYIATSLSGDENNIVVLDGSGSFESVAYDVSDAGPGALVWNRTGKEDAPNGYWLRWDGVNWAEFGGLQSVSAGDGIEKNGDVITVKLANASLVKGANGLQVGDLSATYVTPAALNTAIADFATDSEVTSQISTALEDYSTATEVTAEIEAAKTELEGQFNGSFYTVTSPAAVTTLEVTHNLGFRWPTVQVVDFATNKLIGVGAVSFDSTSKLTISLSVAARIIVMVSWAKTVA